MPLENVLPGIPYVPFPIAFHTVDVIPFYFYGNEFMPRFLFGRKPAEEKFRCLGGFVDPTDDSAEFGAYREIDEEGLIRIRKYKYEPFLPNPFKMQTVYDYMKHLHKFHYIGSFNNGDKRFKDVQHKIITSLYIILVNDTEINQFKPGDDIAELKWFKEADLLKLELFEKVHHGLITAFYERCLA